MKKLSVILLGLLLSIPGFAQNDENKDNEFSMSAQLRSRAEYRDGYGAPHADGVDPGGFIDDRARLSFDYKRDNLSLGFSAQQVGVWGQDPQIASNGRTMINEAWANLNFGDGFFMKLGRQSLIYDDERILGGLDWNVAGRYHDALKFGYENPMNKLNLVLAYNQNSEGNPGNPNGTYYTTTTPGPGYKTMQMLWYQHIGSKLFNISFLAMNLGLETGTAPAATDVKYLQTFGTNISYQPGSFQLYGTFYYQTGKATATATPASKDVSAYMGALNLSYAFTPQWKLMAASDYMSGDDGKDPSKFTAFNPLFGTHHKFYGTMDYFYANPFLTGLNPGLWDNQLGLSFKAAPKVLLGLNYHYFLTTTDVTVDDATRRALGSEWDFQVTWNVMKDVAFTGGYSTFFGNDVLKAVKGGDPSKSQNWLWVSLNINPKIFAAKW